ncbi:MAG: hypothetical protein AAFQ53_14855 [Bacteroidota bacterium]
MRSAVTLLLLVVVAFVAPVEAWSAVETPLTVPVETHFPAETAAEGDSEVMHLGSVVNARGTLGSSTPPEAFSQPRAMLDVPPTPPPER